MPSREASWHHGSSVSVIFTPMRFRSSSSPWSVIFGNSVAGVVFSACAGMLALQIAQDLAMDLSRRRLRQIADEGHVTRVLVLAQARARELLQLAREAVVARAGADDEGLHDLAAQGVG